MTEASIQRLDRALAPVFRFGEAAARASFRIGGFSLAAAAVLIAGLAAVVWSGPWWIWLFWSLAAAGLCAPGLALIVFGQSLRQLMRLPSSIASQARAGLETARIESGALDGGPVRRLWRFGLHLFRMRDVYLESSSQIAQTALLVRLANPVTAIVLLASVAVTLLLIPTAAIVLLITLL